MVVQSPVSDQSENADFYVTFSPNAWTFGPHAVIEKKLRPDLAGFLFEQRKRCKHNSTVEQPVFHENFSPYARRQKKVVMFWAKISPELGPKVPKLLPFIGGHQKWSFSRESDRFMIFERGLARSTGSWIYLLEFL